MPAGAIAFQGGTMRHKITRKAEIAILTLLGALAAVGVGYAAIPSANGVIHGCYNAGSNPSGSLRVIDARRQMRQEREDARL
jgi:hypothetical protein